MKNGRPQCKRRVGWSCRYAPAMDAALFTRSPFSWRELTGLRGGRPRKPRRIRHLAKAGELGRQISGEFKPKLDQAPAL